MSANAVAEHDRQALAEDLWLLAHPLSRPELGSRTENLRMIAVDGGSMEPLLSRADRILVDVSRRVRGPVEHRQQESQVLLGSQAVALSRSQDLFGNCLCRRIKSRKESFSCNVQQA